MTVKSLTSTGQGYLNWIKNILSDCFVEDSYTHYYLEIYKKY